MKLNDNASNVDTVIINGNVTVNINAILNIVFHCRGKQ